jgi:hypothetical protein
MRFESQVMQVCIFYKINLYLNSIGVCGGWLEYFFLFSFLFCYFLFLFSRDGFVGASHGPPLEINF